MLNKIKSIDTDLIIMTVIFIVLFSFYILSGIFFANYFTNYSSISIGDVFIYGWYGIFIILSILFVASIISAIYNFIIDVSIFLDKE